jgi:protein-L-isoaspartate(D-aspartate) O-methyltransferase
LGLAILLFGLVVVLSAQSGEESFQKLRDETVGTQLAGWRWGVEAVRDPVVLDAFRRVPRHRFVSETLSPYAYEDRPLPIGFGQTISQPYIVAKMTELVQPRKGHRALEIGTDAELLPWAWRLTAAQQSSLPR